MDALRLVVGNLGPLKMGPGGHFGGTSKSSFYGWFLGTWKAQFGVIE